MTELETELLAALKALHEAVTMSDVAFCWPNVYAGIVIAEAEKQR